MSRIGFPPRAVVQVLLFVVLLPLSPLLLSGQWGWWEAWVYAAIYIVGFALSRALAARRHPDLLAERARFTEHEGARSWDRWLAPLVGLGGGLIPIAAGLDARYGWSPSYSIPAKAAALVIILAGYGLASYALIENRFFSGIVRIQSDRGHRVVSSGPYRWIRHPGYAGALLAFLGTPILLDSRWAFPPAVLISIALLIRTHLEDETLMEELPGYRDFSEQVRYRLLPGVW